MAGMDVVNTQHAVPLAPLHDHDTRVRTDAVVIEQPFDVDG